MISAIDPIVRLFYVAVASFFWYGVAREHEWTDGALLSSILLTAAVIYLMPLNTGQEEKKPARKLYQSDGMLIAPGGDVLIDLTGIPEGHRDILQINLSADGVAVQVAITGPHPAEPILKVDGGWGTHWGMTQVRRYQARLHAAGENTERPASTPPSQSQ